MLQALIDLIEKQFAELPDKRKASPNRKYSVRDAALSAFAVFMMQSPSFLAQQRTCNAAKAATMPRACSGCIRFRVTIRFATSSTRLRPAS